MTTISSHKAAVLCCTVWLLCAVGVVASPIIDAPLSVSATAARMQDEPASVSAAGRELGNKNKKDKKDKKKDKKKKKEEKNKKKNDDESNSSEDDDKDADYEEEEYENDEYDGEYDGDGDGDEAYGYDNEEEKSEEYNYYDEEEQLEEDAPVGRVPNDYRLLEDGSAVLERLLSLKRRFPYFVSLHNTQDEFHLQPSGGDQDCAYEHFGAKKLATHYTHGCRHWYLVIEDQRAHPEGSESWKRLPEVFWSGALHGDERVGPTAVVEAAELLLESAACEQLPRSFGPQSSRWNHGHNRSMWHADMLGRRFCETALADSFGLSARHRRWLGRLASTRRIVVMPTPNALGFHRNERDEGGVDPNHDFAYDRSNDDDGDGQDEPSHCMRTVAARSLNAIFRQHMFQLALSFHSGDECIGYVWGTTQHTDAPSPDEVALYRIAGAYSDFGGKFKDTHHYKLLWNNERIHGGVHGGFEDWAYAGSWDTANVPVCRPDEDEYGAYPELETIYNDSTLRALTMYIGTSNAKEPDADTLGNDADVFAPVGEGSGNIPRNVRVSLLSLELAQPYVEIVAVDGLTRPDNGVIPGMPRWNRTSCTQHNVVSLPRTTRTVTVEFTVGGALLVEDVRVVYAKWTDVPAEIGCGSHPQSREEWGPYAKWGTPVGPTSGFTQWSNEEGTASPRDDSASEEVLQQEEGPIFVSQLKLDGFEKGDAIGVWAMAKVDAHWADLTSTGDVQPEGVGPQSHLVNARTNPLWFHESAGKIVEGREYFASIPLTLVLRDDFSGPPQAMVNRLEGTEPLTGLTVESTVAAPAKSQKRSWGLGKVNSASSDSEKDEPFWMRDEFQYLVAFGVVSCLLYCTIRCACRRRRRRAQVASKEVEEVDLSPLKNHNGDEEEEEEEEKGAYRDDPLPKSGDVEMKNYTIT